MDDPLSNIYASFLAAHGFSKRSLGVDAVKVFILIPYLLCI